MSYVRRILSEETTTDHVIRRYEVETPQDPEFSHGSKLRDRFDRLVVLELWLTHTAADYFSDVPYTLANEVWLTGADFDLGWAFVTSTREALTIHGIFQKQALLSTLENKWNWRSGPIPILVELWDEAHPFWGTWWWWWREVKLYRSSGVWVARRDVAAGPIDHEGDQK